MLNVQCEHYEADGMDSFRVRRAHAQHAAELEESLLGSCDCTSYCYFTLALVLLTVGSIITALALDEGGDNMFSSLGHMWLVGPIFISSGFMVVVKTVLYLRKKNLMALILRQRALLRELQGLQAQNHLVRNPSILTLPPAYDIVVSQPEPCQQTSENCDETVRSTLLPSTINGTSQEEPPPPTYEEAMLLGLQSRNQNQFDSQNFIENSRTGKNAEA